MKNKKRPDIDPKKAPNSNQTKQTTEKTAEKKTEKTIEQKQSNRNQKMNNDNLNQELSPVRRSTEYGPIQSPTHNNLVKRHSLCQEKNCLSFETQSPRIQDGITLLNRNINNSNQNKESQQPQNPQVKKNPQIRAIQLQNFQKNLKKDQAYKYVHNISQAESQQQIPTIDIQRQQKSVLLQPQSQEQPSTSHNQVNQNNKLVEQSNISISSLPNSPQSKTCPQFNTGTRKSNSLNSKERPLLTHKSQNDPVKDNSDKKQQLNLNDTNENQRKKKGESSNLKSSKCTKLEFSKSTSIIYYIDNPHPPEIIGNIVALLDDQPTLAFNANQIISESKSNEKIKEIKKDPIDHSPDLMKKANLLSEEEEEKYYTDKTNQSDLMNNYWPDECESRRTFEEEFDFDGSMRVSSIRSIDDVLSSSSPRKEEEMPPPVPQQLADMEKKYMPAPPSPLSPYHAFNPRKYHHNLFSRIIRHAGTPSASPKDQKILNTPNRESRNDDEIFNEDEYIESPKRIDIDMLMNIENSYDYYDYDYDYNDQYESESESESENDKEKKTEIKPQNENNDIKNKTQSKDNNENENENKITDENENKITNKNKNKITEENENKITDENENKDENVDVDNKTKKQENDQAEDPFMNTNKNLIPELRNYERLISLMDSDDVFDMVKFIENELKGFNNMTSIKGPLYEEEMTVVRFQSMDCEVIELIHPKAFDEFRFGNCVYYNDDVSPDELHICAWHNLGIDPDHVSISLDKFVKENILGKNDINNIYGVLRYILKWIQLFPDDFVINPGCAVHTCKVLNRVIDKRNEVSPRSNFLKALIRAISQKKKPYTAVHYPLPEVQYQEIRKYQRISIYDKIYKFEKDVDFLVHHFTYIDLSLLRKILRSEIVQLNFLKEDKKFSAPHVSDITTRFNIMARFVSYTILSVVRNHSSKLEKKCRSRIEFWITVMKKARDIRNFNLLYEIDAGLSHPSIARLTNVWKSISKSIKDDFNKLHDLTLPFSKNMRELINLFLENPENTVPYLGIFFSRIVYSCEYYHKKDKMVIPQDRLDDDAKDKNQNNEITGYNMVYQYYLYKECSKIFSNWGANYKFKIDINFLKVCNDISFTCDDKRLSEFSIQIQPKK